MKILLVRHAQAENADCLRQDSASDNLRPLTAEGRRKMEKSVKGLKKVLPRGSVIVTSPLTRARQTADVLAEGLRLPVIEADVLNPAAGVEKVLAWLSSHKAQRSKGSQEKSKGVIVLVGHEPQLGRLLGYLLTGTRRSIMKLKKGSATLVTCKLGQVRSARMHWSLTGKQLRQVAKRKPYRQSQAPTELAA